LQYLPSQVRNHERDRDHPTDENSIVGKNDGRMAGGMASSPSNNGKWRHPISAWTPPFSRKFRRFPAYEAREEAQPVPVTGL
jgi:hypothetical protein